jgi:uracil-DNA glycosylase
MSATPPRQQAADIARGLRRYLEREHGDHAELLAAAAKKVARRDARGPTAADTRASAPSAVPARGSVVAGRGTPPVAGAVREPDPATHVGRRVVTSAGDQPLNPGGVTARRAIAEAAGPLLKEIAREVERCKDCALWETRTRAVPGVGSAVSGIVFVGEAPGADEDRKGEPFVGRAGQLLDRIIKAMDDAQLIPGVSLTRDTVFIGNVIHCRPPDNRVPAPFEVEQSSPFLRRQLEALKPRVICCLGKTAAEHLLGRKGSLGGMRGQTYRMNGAKMIVTYHPAAVLRNPDYKRPVWEDMQRLAREYQSE